MGDPIIERAVDYVLADEITHVRMGSKWMRKLTEGDPERLQRAQQFQDNIDTLFNFEGVALQGRGAAGAAEGGQPEDGF